MSMNIKINSISFSKEELLSSIKKSKLETIKHIKSITNIGLKDAKEIVDSLDDDPNCYDNIDVKKEVVSFSKNENIINKEDRKGAHFIQNKKALNKYIIFGLILIVIILIGLLIK